jgi:hypothetical protein
MANYAHVVDGNIEGVYDLIPNNWKNISNFHVFTEEERLSVGWYTLVKAYPEYNPETQKIDNPRQYFSDGVAYETMDIIELPRFAVYEPTPEDIQLQQEFSTNAQWNLIRGERDTRMSSFEWRYTRYDRQVRLGETPVDNLTLMDAYMQALADITTQTDPFNIIWPEFGG